MNMVNCSIYGCSNTGRNNVGEKKVSFYRFPKNPEFSRKWTNACKRKDYINIKTARICSIHFTPNDYARSLKHELLNYWPASARKLKDDAIPSQNACEGNIIDTGLFNITLYDVKHGVKVFIFGSGSQNEIHPNNDYT